MNKNSLILIDTSYTSFYRFFATMRWYSFSLPEEFKKYKEDVTYNWLENKIFIEKYEKMYMDSIIKLVGKKIFASSKIIFCMDSPKEQLWRTDKQCDYKSTRADMTKKYNFKPTFSYTYEHIIPNIINANNNISSIRVDKIEADDVIGIITMHLKNINQKIIVISGDNDLLQLGRENVTFYNYKSKTPTILTEKEALVELHKKIIFGDPSDCIPGIFKKGAKVSIIKKTQLTEDMIELNNFLIANPDVKKQYDANQEMINFKSIPQIYVDKVINIFNSTK